jgi:hypothetical protein
LANGVEEFITVKGLCEEVDTVKNAAAAISYYISRIAADVQHPDGSSYI